MAIKEDTYSTVMHFGPATFMNRPVIPCDAEELKKKKVKAAVLGYPYDSTTVGRPGATLGPRRIRDLSNLYLPYNMGYDVNIVEKYNLVDVGDVCVKIGHTFETLQRGKAAVLEILKAGAMPVMIGGEHSITIAPALAFEEFTPKANYGFINFDSHLDTAADVDGDPYTHSSPVARVTETKVFNPKNSVVIGACAATNPLPEVEYCKKNGISYFTMNDVYRDGILEVTKKAMKIASEGTDGVYITFDMDSLEACHTPGTGAPTSGGLTTREVLMAIDLLGKINLIGFDVCEVAPPYDHSDISAITAGAFVDHMLASRARYI